MAAERGNALFIILIGIVLFAALTAAVTGSFRGGNSALSGSRIEALASDSIMSAAGIEKAVGKMLAKGISETRLSFTRAAGDGYELTPAETADEKVFNIAGGGAQNLDVPKDVLDHRFESADWFGEWYFTGYHAIPGIGLQDRGELLAILPYVRKEICQAINKQFGIVSADPPATPTVTYGHFSHPYIGTYNFSYIDDPSEATKNKKAACMETTDGDGRYFFYYVLLAR